MNTKANLLEDYINFVDLTKKQNSYFKKVYFHLWSFFVCFCFLFDLKTIQSGIYRIIIIMLYYSHNNKCNYIMLFNLKNNIIIFFVLEYV